MLRRISVKFILLAISAPKLISTQEIKPSINDTVPSKDNSTLSDVPRVVDLPIYLNVLDKIISFCIQHGNYIDINFEIGLLLANVNIKHILINKKVGLPIKLRRRLSEIARKFDTVLAFFIRMTNQDQIPKEQKIKHMIILFRDQTQWVQRVQKFENVLWKPPKPLTEAEKEDAYIDWAAYFRNAIAKSTTWKPNPLESDQCLMSLALSPIRKENGILKCHVAANCYNIVINGTDFGYALIHRLLFLLLARYSRGCSIYSPKLDRGLARRFCKSIYWESEYIAENGFQALDLIAEQMVLCALDGEVHFLRRSWIKELLKFQTKGGCFTTDPKSIDKEKLILENGGSVIEYETMRWRFMQTGKGQYIYGKLCHSHITSIAAGLLATTIRLISTVYF